MLNLNDNKLEAIPEEIAQLIELNALYLSGNNLSELPESIKELKHLKVLMLVGNPISEAEQAKIKGWLPQCEIRF